VARYGRFGLVALISLAIASTGLCTALSTGASSCPIAQTSAADHDSCCTGEPENDACPASKERPTCRMCDDTVAFLVEGRSDGASVPLARAAVVAAVVSRPAVSVRVQADSLHLSQLSSSPPRHLLNVTFRN
jgi:hypothetical protein